MHARLLAALLVLSAAVASVSLVGTAHAQENELAGMRAATKAARNDATAANALGRGLLRAGRYREAETELRRAARLAHNAPEAVYAIAIMVPAGCTLDLNHLHLYARSVQVAGTVVNGTISRIGGGQGEAPLAGRGK